MKNLSDRPIGVFDSGVGGLTVVKGLRRALPEEDILYFGDTARVPYGNKSRSTIKRFSREIIDFLIGHDVKLIVAACNTASSLAVPSLRSEYDVPVIGVIEAGVKEAMRVTRNGRIGVIGTASTVSSRAYEKALERKRCGYKIYQKSCPLFVPLVENKHLNDHIALETARMYLESLKKKRIDTLILGCTHYPLLKNTISRIMDDVQLVDSASSVAKTVEGSLNKSSLRNTKKKSRIKCFVSDDVKGFTDAAGLFLKETIFVKKVAEF